MRFAIYSEREQRRRDDRQTMDGGQVRIPRRRAEYEYRCRSRTAFSPAGSVRVGYGLPSAGHSLPSALRCPKFLCSLPLREISTAARFTPCLLPPPAAARRETPFESLSYQKRKALLRSAFLFWQPNRDSNPNIQSQSLLCYRYTIRLYLLLAENSISVCSPVVNSFLQFSKNYA